MTNICCHISQYRFDILLVFIVQNKDVVNMNGEKIENASDEEESEEVDSEETEEPVSAVEETSEPISQVRTETH